jgi:hypothetical protein
LLGWGLQGTFHVLEPVLVDDVRRDVCLEPSPVSRTGQEALIRKVLAAAITWHWRKIYLSGWGWEMSCVTTVKHQ